MLKTFYDDKNVEYSKIGNGRKKALSILCDGFVDSKKVLDLGCGQGTLARLWKAKSSHVIFYGADVSSVALDRASSALDRKFLIDFQNFREWPKEILETEFDYIVMSEVLEHLLEPENFMISVRKITTNNTKVVITVPNLLFWKNRLRILFGNFEYKESGTMDRGHVHFFSWKSLNALLKEGGYEVEKVINVVPDWYMRPFSGLFPGLFSYQFALRVKLTNSAS